MPAFSTRVPARRDDPPNQMRRTSLANMRPRRGALKSVKPARPVAQSGRSSTTSAKARNVSFAPGPDQGSALSAKRSWPTFHLPRVQPESGEEARRARIRARRLEQEVRAEGGERGTAGRRVKSATPGGARSGRVTRRQTPCTQALQASLNGRKRSDPAPRSSLLRRRLPRFQGAFATVNPDISAKAPWRMVPPMAMKTRSRIRVVA
ncbi:unnamed protein product (mitochondrion) [Plasmodiophora brassicae]|uniref:Uncharacterized protein n=1 Tax=Plasmodiophora brassicae TaxID=37360 RepID=A0A3P3XZ64_PLABS|nr:unnamed protein product [Plasmodiophora brassicae]